ncbi:hypothetical protein MA16_Dca008408 [Dendrobium catenatum]|uniref:Uncharacterized protein n=1 Tax=Dendrobium catenatum TaxID=906689 RepID=A0A2I0VM47_9ASPA|nr:hypothetical protein MA16_Dca008408 [Dendrobium catenatum]
MALAFPLLLRVTRFQVPKGESSWSSRLGGSCSVRGANLGEGSSKGCPSELDLPGRAAFAGEGANPLVDNLDEQLPLV